jgi:hypothetical protein
MNRFLTLATHMMHKRKCLTVTNTLAYYVFVKITTEKKFYNTDL